jgi:hypothetical protein
MEHKSDHFEIIKKNGEKVYSGEVMSFSDLELKTEPHDEIGTIHTEIFEKQNNSELLQIIGEKRKNKEKSYLENGTRKIKEEFVVFEESDYKQEIEEIQLDNQVNKIIHLRR